MHRLLKSNLIAIILFLLITPTTALSQQQKAEAKKNIVEADFTYSSKDLRDPFEPVYLTKLKERRASGAAREGYELEELKLVGVLKTTGAKFAMMEDMQGKGLLFKQGDYINKITWVMDIQEDKVTMAYRIKGDIRKIAIDIPKK